MRRLTWRARRYLPGVPNSGRVRAFKSEARALRWAADQRALGWATEVWTPRPLPGVLR